MKPTSSKSDGKKKKREDPGTQPVIECVKKGKVQAQRKFAQVSGSPGCAPIPTSFSARDRDKTKALKRTVPVPKTPLLTNRVPTTSQFLDFLCFGRTSLLPPSLHYLRDATLATTSTIPPPKLPTITSAKKEDKVKERPAVVKEKALPVKEKPAGVKEKPAAVKEKSGVLKEKPAVVKEKPNAVKEKPLPVKEKPNVAKEKPTPVKEKPTVVKEKPASVKEKTPAVKEKPASVKGRCTTAPAPKVPEALLKKYHDQRLARQKSTSVTKLAQKVKGKIMVRTRSTVNKEEVSKSIKSVIAVKNVKKPAVVAVKRALQRGKKSDNSRGSGPNTTRHRNKKLQRAGLRSSGKLDHVMTIAAKDTSSKPKKTDPEIPKEKESVKTAVPETVSKQKGRPARRTHTASEASSDDEPLLTKRPRVSGQKSRVQTRSKVADEVQKSILPTREKPDAAAGHQAQKRFRKSVGKQETLQQLRRATRSTPVLERPQKTQLRPARENAIRELIQKKKQMSLKTLSRLKTVPKKPLGQQGEKTVQDKPAKGSRTPKTKIVNDEADKKDSLRKLRGKVGDSTEVQKMDFTEKEKQKMTEVLEDPKTSKVLEEPKNSRVASKRPVRKCSTVDKMWIDVDGFTSDEDDFIDMESITEGSKNAAIPDTNRKETKTKQITERKTSKDDRPPLCSKDSQKNSSEQDTVPKNEEKRASRKDTRALNEEKIAQKKLCETIAKKDKEVSVVEVKSTTDTATNCETSPAVEVPLVTRTKPKNHIIPDPGPVKSAKPESLAVAAAVKPKSQTTSVVELKDKNNILSAGDLIPTSQTVEDLKPNSQIPSGADSKCISDIQPKSPAMTAVDRKPVKNAAPISKIMVSADAKFVNQVMPEDVKPKTNAESNVMPTVSPKTEIKKEINAKPLTFSSLIDPTLFPKTAARLKSFEMKDFERSEQKEDIGLMGAFKYGSTAGTSHTDNSHSLIARLDNNNPAVTTITKPSDLKLINREINASTLATPMSRLTQQIIKQEKIVQESAVHSVRRSPFNESGLHKSEPHSSLTTSNLTRQAKPDAFTNLVMATKICESIKITEPLASSQVLSRKATNSFTRQRDKRVDSVLKNSGTSSTACTGDKYECLRKERALSSDKEIKRHVKENKGKMPPDSSEESDASLEKIVRRKRTRGPSPRAEVVTRKERPKRQCSTMGKSWIERDSDDSSFYDDQEDVLELIRKSELEEKRREGRKTAEGSAKLEVNESRVRSDTFSESDDEPLMKKNLFAPSPGSLLSADTAGRSTVGSAAIPSVDPSSMPAPAVTFRTLPLPREPINTHGLDLLSQVVAVAHDKSKGIEEWLKESIRADGGKGFVAFDDADIRQAPLPVSNSNIPDPVLQFVRTTTTPSKAAPVPVTAEVATSLAKKSVLKEEPVLKRPPVSSVTDLIKLQRERKGSPKPTVDHSKNCKCNSCVVKKAWFKNKPVPEESKPVTKEAPTQPFQALTEAFGEAPHKAPSTPPACDTKVSVAPGELASPPRKMSFLDRMRERERREALVKPPSQPFSPSNESSVYAFEPEGEKMPPKVPTKRAQLTPAPAPLPRTLSKTGQSEVAHPTHPHLSTSIAVQVNLDETGATTESVAQDDGKSMEISTQTEGSDDEADSHLYYIPLQQGGDAPLIQGVTVKLGTEGPFGPHQKVVMQAKLVTMNSTIKPAVVPPAPAAPPPVVQEDKNKMTPPAGAPVSTGTPVCVSVSTGTPVGAPAPVGTPVVAPVPAGSPVGAVQPKSRRPSSSRTSVSPSSSKSSKSCAKPGRSDSPLQSNSPRPSKDVPKPTTSPVAKTPKTELVVEAPTFHLTEKDLQDPLEFLDRIRPQAERFGICRIVPPTSFKPDCKKLALFKEIVSDTRGTESHEVSDAGFVLGDLMKVADDMRFTAYNQYVHRMFHRWGPSVKETMAMKKYLKTQRISLKPPPCVGGVEVDLPRLYQAVQTCGGLMKVMEKEKWQQVADLLRLPKAAHDRASKLDAIYCQYLLPYDTLKDEERQKLLVEVDSDWAAHEKKIGQDAEASDPEDEEENYIEECEECMVKGRSMALNQFFRIARNTMSMWFKSAEPEPADVEAEYWRLVNERKQHVCVHSGSIDSSGWGYGFPIGKNTFAKHPWNLKVLTNNSGSVLRSLGPVMGVTVPTLHVGMVFAAFCWYRDPHGLPWVDYLHTGAPKIWYGISDDNSSIFREALTKLMPKNIKEQRIWLPCDTAMVPPAQLAQLGVPLSRITQYPGQFVLVFPRSFTSSLCTGYLVSESVYFARPSWLQTAEEAFRDIHDSSEPSVFSLDNLLLSIAQDNRASLELLKSVLPMVQRLCERERTGREALRKLGLVEEPLPREKVRRRGRSQDPEPDHECDVCRMTLYLSMVSCAAEETVYCLRHGLLQLTEHKDQIPGAKLLYSHDQSEIEEVIEKLEDKISTKRLKSKK